MEEEKFHSTDEEKKPVRNKDGKEWNKTGAIAEIRVA